MSEAEMTSPEPDPDKEYPPDPHYGFDRRGYWRYMDYDGESLQIKINSEGDLIVDKHGEGFVFIRAEDIPLIVAAITTPGLYPSRRRGAA